MHVMNTHIKEIYSDYFTALTWYCIGYASINLIESVSAVAALILSIIYLMFLPVFIRSITGYWRKEILSAKDIIKNATKRDKKEWLFTMMFFSPFLLLRFFFEESCH